MCKCTTILQFSLFSLWLLPNYILFLYFSQFLFSSFLLPWKIKCSVVVLASYTSWELRNVCFPLSLFIHTISLQILHDNLFLFFTRKKWTRATFWNWTLHGHKVNPILYCGTFLVHVLQRYPSSLLFVALKGESNREVIVLCNVVSSTFGRSNLVLVFYINLTKTKTNMKTKMRTKSSIQIRMLIFNKLFQCNFYTWLIFRFLL